MLSSNTIVFQGDSITDCGRNYDIKLPANVGLGDGYPFMIMAGLREASPEKDWQVYNRGISGHRIVDLYARWKRDTINLKPGILSILIGVNDTWHEFMNQNGVDVPRYKQFYRMLLEWTRKELPETKIILMEPFVLPFGAVQGDVWLEEMAQRAEITAQMAKEFDTLFLPVQKLLNDACKRAPQEYWLKDGVHPNYAGHMLISKAWMDATADIRK